MKYILPILFALILIFPGELQATRTDSLLRVLDQVITEQPTYIAEKEREIRQLKDLIHHTRSDEQLYDIYWRLTTAYYSFNTDSIYFYARKKLETATRLNNPGLMADSKMNIADAMAQTGMYKEALDHLDMIHKENLPSYLYPYYYHLHLIIYQLLESYSSSESEKKKYSDLAAVYRDSVILEPGMENATRIFVEAEKLNISGHHQEALLLLEDFRQKETYNTHMNAVLGYLLSITYKGLNDREQEKQHLILSAIADLQDGIREYISLRELAILLYQDGDIERAYRYMQQSMNDALACNARLRVYEMVETFPLINQAYQIKIQGQQEKLKHFLFYISLLSFCLLLLIFYIYRQMRRLAAARNEVIATNSKLKELNEELHDFNDQLTNSNTRLAETNRDLSDASRIKEEYIGRFMDQCSIYLGKMEEYRKSLGKTAATGKVEDLYRQIRSKQFIEDELEEFYKNFDETFLTLFPTFVEEINQLLAEEERIVLKPGERLNTGLRIYALMRLGITDSSTISRFLRYPVTTIYNYRTRLRNKAAGNRDHFENEVMNIGKHV